VLRDEQVSAARTVLDVFGYWSALQQPGALHRDAEADLPDDRAVARGLDPNARAVGTQDVGQKAVVMPGVSRRSAARPA
jgi:hypothetical protein